MTTSMLGIIHVYTFNNDFLMNNKLLGWMDIKVAFTAHKDMERNVYSVLLLNMLNRRHFDYLADFHTDSKTMFAYLAHSLRLLVNWNESRKDRDGPFLFRKHRWRRVHDINYSACRTGEEFARHKTSHNIHMHECIKKKTDHLRKTAEIYSRIL